MSLERVLALAGGQPAAPDPDAGLLLSAQTAARDLAVLLASDDNDDDDGGGKGDQEGGGDHSGHATYKALMKRGVPPKKASTMCAASDKKVKAAALAESLAVILSGRPGLDIGLVTLTPESETAAGRQAAGEGDALDDGSYLIRSARQLHSAAVLAASHHGDWKGAQVLIRRMAPKFGVKVSSLPGFGQSDDEGEKAAASMLALAAKAAGDGGIPMNHGAFTGTHTHTHFQSGAHSHPHQHAGDSNHDGGPLHRPGSKPMRNW